MKNNTRIFPKDLLKQMPQYIKCCNGIFTEETEFGSIFHQFVLACWNDDIYMQILAKTNFVKEYKEKYGKDYDVESDDNWLNLDVNVFENGNVELVITDKNAIYGKKLLITNKEEKTFFWGVCEAYARAETGKHMAELFEEYKEERIIWEFLKHHHHHHKMN